MEKVSKDIRKWAEQVQKCVNASLALANAEDAKDKDAIEKTTKEFLFEAKKLEML